MFGYAYRYISTYRVKNGHQYVMFSCEKHGEQTQRLDCHFKSGCKWCKILDSNRRNHALTYVIGVIHGKNKKRVSSCVNDNGKQIFCGYFDDELEAFNAYCKKKYEIINEVAEKYKGKVDVRIYNALKNYKIEITD